MRIIIKTKIALITIITAICYTVVSSFTTSTDEKAFGTRHDKEVKEYEKVGGNQAPYNTIDYPNFSSTVLLGISLDNSGSLDGYATGVLIKPNWVLTVAHNFMKEEYSAETISSSSVTVFTGEDGENPATKHKIEKFILHPTWIEENQESLLGNDICLIKLAEPITKITPANLGSTEDEILGNTIWLGGYGAYDEYSMKIPKRHGVENILDRKMDTMLTTKDGTKYAAGLLACDFDSPDEALNSLGKNKMHPFYEGLLGKGDSNTATTLFEGTSVPGDSGGPLYIKTTNGWKVIGLLSVTAPRDPDTEDEYSYFDYGSITMYTRLTTHRDWIQKTIEK